MEKSTGIDNTKRYISDLPRSSRFLGHSSTLSWTKLLVEAEDLIDAVLANLAFKLGIKISAKRKLRVHSKDLGRECAQ